MITKQLLERKLIAEAGDPETDFIEEFFSQMSESAEIDDSIKALCDEAILPPYFTEIAYKKIGDQTYRKIENQGSFTRFYEGFFEPAEIKIADEELAW